MAPESGRALAEVRYGARIGVPSMTMIPSYISCATRPAAVALAVLALTAGGPADAADIKIDQARFTQGPLTTTYVNLKVSDSSLSEKEWRDALGAQDYTKMSAILSTLNASRFSVDKIEFENNTGGSKDITVIQDVNFASIAKGRAAAGATGRGEMRTGKGREREVTQFDRITLKNTTVVLPPRPTDGSLPIAIGEATIENLRNEAGKNSASAIRSIRVENLRAAALDDAVLTVLSLVGDRDFDALTPLEKSAAAKALGEAYNSFEIGRMTADDIASRDGQERTTIARITLEGGLKPSMTLNGFEVQSGKETTRIGEIRFDDFSFEPTIKSLLAALGDPTNKNDPPLAELLPRLGTVAITDLNVKGAQIGAYGGDTALKSFKLQFNNPMGGVPTGMRISFDGLAAGLNPNDPSSTELLALGYRTINASGAIEMDIDKARDLLSFREVSLSMKDVGTLHLTGSLGKISDVIEATDSTEATLAAMGLTIKTLGIGIANDGLFERVIAKNAKESGKTPDQIKREIASLAALGLPGLLGASPQAKSITDASTRFLAKPERIVFAFKAKSPDGVGLAEIMTIGKPDDFFALTDLTIQAGR